MNPINPTLRELGFQADDRVVVVHADDIGMCYSTLPAIDELMAFGLVTSASAMVPYRVGQCESRHHELMDGDRICRHSTAIRLSIQLQL